MIFSKIYFIAEACQKNLVKDKHCQENIISENHPALNICVHRCVSVVSSSSSA